jgi:uncharacterized protein (TIGR04255 family)
MEFAFKALHCAELPVTLETTYDFLSSDSLLREIMAMVATKDTREARLVVDHSAIVDIQCALSPSLNRGAFHSAAQKVFADQYPEFRTAYVHEQNFTFGLGKAPQAATRQTVRGYQSLTRDKKQIVQSRFDGFSFNRLAPYTTLDDYLPEIARCWALYCGFAAPVVVRRIALRYINRVALPLDAKGRVDVTNFIRTGPVLPQPNDMGLMLTGFLQHHQMTEVETGNMATVVLAAQPPEEKQLSVILDIDAYRPVNLPPLEWGNIVPIISA